MMNNLRQHPVMAGLIGLTILIVSIITIIVSFSDSGGPTRNTSGQLTDPQALTSFYGPLAQASDSLAVNYGDNADPNRGAALQQFRFLGLGSLPLPNVIKELLPTYLTKVLQATTIPTYATAYIQINRSTIKCPTQYDCQFSFYLDSPESYYDFHLFYQPDGQLTHTLQRQPLPGVTP